MKKFIAMLMALTLMLSLAACGGSNAGTAADEGSIKTITDGVLTVALSPDFAPMEFVDATKEGQDKFVGFDVSLSKYIAEELGLTLEIKAMSFDACQTAVAMGSVDMAVSGFSWTEERAENYNLSDYYHAGDNEDEQILITLASNGDKYATAESLVGVKVGAQTASLQESLAKEQLPDSELVVISDLTTAIMQLRNGDFEVMAVAKGNADAMIANNPDLAYSGFNFVVDEKYTGNVIMMQKSNDALTAAVNEILAKAEAAGNYVTWYDEAKATAGIQVAFDDEGNEVGVVE